MSAEQLSIDHPQRSYVLVLVANFLWFFGLSTYISFRGLYARLLGANPVEVGLFSSVFLVSALVWTGLSGPLCTRFGVKRVLILSWLIILPAPIIYILAPSWQWLLLSAVFEGSSWLSTPPLRTYIARVSMGKSRGAAYSLVVSSIALAGIPAPVLGGFLIQWFGYPVIFLLAAMIFVMSTFFLLPISSIPQQQAETKQKRQQRYFSNRIFILSTVFMAVIISLSFFTRDFIPLFLEDHWGLQEDVIGVLMAIFNGSAVLLAPLIGIAGDRVGYSKILPLPIFGLLGSLGLIVIAPSPLWLYPIFAVRGTFFGIFSLMNALASKHIPQDQMQSAFTTYTFLQRLPSPITPLFGGISYGLDPSLPFIVSTFILPFPLAINVLLHRAEKHRIKPLQTEELE